MAACLPAIVIAGGITATVVAKLSCRGQIAYARSRNVVEYTVGAVRRVRHEYLSFITPNKFMSFSLKQLACLITR